MEFVHPVIVGKRALPAVALVDADPVVRLRASAQPGDGVAVVADAADRVAADVVRRAEAWGVESLWIGSGPRPAAGAAHHVLWLDGEPDAPHDGRGVLLYHLLWELTHVCFEHPGLLRPSEEPEPEVCVTCADEGNMAEVVAPVGGDQALVRMADGRQTIDVALVGPVGEGDLLLVHAGSAITSLS